MPKPACWAAIVINGSVDVFVVSTSTWTTGYSFSRIVFRAVAISGLVGFWPLNSKYGTRDVSGNGNHGAAIGDVKQARGVNNERGGAYRFHG